MSDKSRIGWTDATWNPVTGCSPISSGCANCYARRMAYRLKAIGAKHYANEFKPTCHPDLLDQPLRWTRPRRIFVCSMGDIYHEDVQPLFRRLIWDRMQQCPLHRFQILTKRPERMAEELTDNLMFSTAELPNVWLGTSCEDQAAADERIPHLLRCPAAVRWISLEPLLGPIDVDHACMCACGDHRMYCLGCDRTNINWVVVGGESGPGARPCNVAWIRDIIRQCNAAEVPCYVKQLGAWPYDSDWYGDGTPEDSRMLLNDRKGADMAEWPEDLRMREYPA